MRFFLIGLIWMCFSVSCATVSKKTGQQTGILHGITGIYEGNCMPSPGVPPCQARPSSITLLITSPSEEYDSTMLVKRVTSSDDGVFEVELSPGNYSLFLLDGEDVVCPAMSCPDACYCQPFEIISGERTKVNPNLDKATW